MPETVNVISRDTLWGQHTISGTEFKLWDFGPLRLWCKQNANEVWIGYQHGDFREPHETDELSPPEALSWSRWAFNRAVEKLRFVPIFPDKSVVVKPEHPFRIVQKAEARIYVRVPIWVRIEPWRKRDVGIVEVPTLVLSKTWFGTFKAGELCYWISSDARRDITPDYARPFLAICPVQIINSADMELFVEKLALRVRRFSIFNLKGQLWSDEVTVSYRGKENVSQISLSGKAPPEAEEGELVGPPRDLDKKGFAAKTFTSLRDLPGFDLLTR
ncbi:DUF432 domain-containing protein [candidate division KSB1 bacterium]|nr:DUF432 domain-containing protein [candidate division KSB1 bacterium]NIR68627.1 DUF432 domain-containing protein [candidate division KSB1 bacterium]NIS28197.1 DUF432 domain-containing protein [candidate division KSB1 bacterium]NIT75088.1 DUF432 domain-containing protein [candidate division KSB1 bacterium]NIU28873.1 DUF432 domain-containing protein [candidate division KSB1 bacterium]